MSLDDEMPSGNKSQKRKISQIDDDTDYLFSSTQNGEDCLQEGQIRTSLVEENKLQTSMIAFGNE